MTFVKANQKSVAGSRAHPTRCPSPPRKRSSSRSTLTAAASGRCSGSRKTPTTSGCFSRFTASCSRSISQPTCAAFITGRTCARRHALHVRAQQICSEHYWLAVYGFRGTFVGINNTRTPRPRTNRRGRGRGLHALFQDTFSDIEARLVTDSDATLEAICSNLVRPDAREFDVG